MRGVQYLSASWLANRLQQLSITTSGISAIIVEKLLSCDFTNAMVSSSSPLNFFSGTGLILQPLWQTHAAIEQLIKTKTMLVKIDARFMGSPPEIVPSTTGSSRMSPNCPIGCR